MENRTRSDQSMTILIHQSGSAIPFSLSDNAIPTAHHPVHLANSFRLLVRKSLLVICSDQNLPAIYKAPLDQSQARDPSRSGNPPPGPDHGRWSPRHRASERVIGLAVQRWRYKKSARTKEPIIRPTLKKAAAMLRSPGVYWSMAGKEKRKHSCHWPEETDYGNHTSGRSWNWSSLATPC